MPQARSNGLAIEYDSFGDPSDPTLLLIMGYTAQMTAWPAEFCERLAGNGRFVVRFDNRDCGLSTKTDGSPPNLMAIMTAVASGQPLGLDVPYSLSDMAADAMAVLEAVGAERAHVAGASMGGMIAQQVAIDHPDRVQTLTSIMSTTGAPNVGQAEPKAMTALLTPPPTGREAAIERGVEVGRLISGPLFDENLARQAMTDAFDRSFYPRGAAFQLAAIVKTGDRTEMLRKLNLPTLVIHGKLDPLVTPSGGEATAAAIAGAKLMMVDEMGHDLPRLHWGTIVDAITTHTSTTEKKI